MYLNYLVDHPLNHPEERVGLLLHCGLLLGLFAILFYYCWPLIPFGCLVWCLVTFNGRSGRLSPSESGKIVLHLVFLKSLIY